MVLPVARPDKQVLPLEVPIFFFLMWVVDLTLEKSNIDHPYILNC
jgi:hypothetical protein